jgi:hypothetical protein
MGTVDSNTNHCQSKYTRLKFINSIPIYHFGEVEHYYDENTNQEVIKTNYDFILEADTEVEFINKLKNNNNKCPYLISMLKIDT